jgi:uncharacterized protein YlzI (FlbEa/FlbD family)
MSIYLNESTLASSEVFTGINEMSEENQIQKAIRLINNLQPVTKEDIEAVYLQIRQYPNSLTRAALQAFEEENTIILFNEVKQNSVSKALPFITFKRTNGIKSYIFLDNFSGRNRDGLINVQAPIIHDLLIGALISNALKRNYIALASNESLQKVLMEIYFRLMMRILNREYSIGADKVIFDSIQYFINKFFLFKVFGVIIDNQEDIETLLKNNFKYIDNIKYEEIKALYTEVNPNNISELLTLFNKIYPRINPALKNFLSSWISYYYTPATLAIDTIEYLIFMIITLLNGNNIININASEIIKEAKNIKIFNAELLKII